MNRHPVRALLALLAVLAAACGKDGDSIFDPADPPGTIFIVESQLPGAYYDAMVRGRLVRDGAGCLRLDGAGALTVIWPLGSTIEIRNGEIYVLNREGQQLAKVGDQTELGGRHSDTIDRVYLSERDRHLALNHCPGEYWLAQP